MFCICLAWFHKAWELLCFSTGRQPLLIGTPVATFAYRVSQSRTRRRFGSRGGPQEHGAVLSQATSHDGVVSLLGRTGQKDFTLRMLAKGAGGATGTIAWKA